MFLRVSLQVDILLLCAVWPSIAMVGSGKQCRILQLFPFQDSFRFSGRGEQRGEHKEFGFARWTPASIQATGVSFTAAATLAIADFNERNPVIVPELSSLQDCEVTLDGATVDSQLNNLEAGSAILQYAQRYNETDVCAVLGPYAQSASTWTAAITGSLDLPHVAFSETQPLFTDPDTFLHTIALAENGFSYVEKILNFLKLHDRNHFGIIRGGNTFDTNLAKLFQDLGGTIGVTVQIFALNAPPKGISLADHAAALYERVRDSGIRTLMRSYSAGPDSLLKTSEAALKTGLLEDDFLWLFMEFMVPIFDDGIFDGIEEGSSLDSLLSNSIVFGPTGPSAAFLGHWTASSLVNEINQSLPRDQPTISEDYFQEVKPRRGSGYVYDAIMAIGFGACHAQESGHNGRAGEGPRSLQLQPAPQGNPPGAYFDGPPQAGENTASSPSSSNGIGPQERPPPVPFPPIPEATNPHVLAIAGSQFHGATGLVHFKKEGEAQMRFRSGRGVGFGAFNIRGTTVNGTRFYEPVLVSTFLPSNEGEWVNVPGESIVYRDGTTDPPLFSRVIEETNYLPGWACTFGLTIMSISILFAIVCIVLVWRWRNEPLVCAGQPAYLQTLNFGSILISASIFCLSFDEGHGWSNRQLSLACTMAPWLFFVGINTTWAGLFCKLWRVELLSQFRRRQIKVWQTMWPLGILVLSTILCLALWTGIDPWVWTRTVTVEYPVPESYGGCSSDNFAAFFTPLACIMIVCTVLSGGTAWKTRELRIGNDQRFDDSNAVFVSIASQLQAWILGLPILAVLGDQSSVSATYLGRVLLIWLFSIGTIALVVFPKVLTTFRWRRNPSLVTSNSRVTVSGLGSAHGDSSPKIAAPGRNPELQASVQLEQSNSTLMTPSSFGASTATLKTDISNRSLKSRVIHHENLSEETEV